MCRKIVVIAAACLASCTLFEPLYANLDLKDAQLQVNKGRIMADGTDVAMVQLTVALNGGASPGGLTVHFVADENSSPCLFSSPATVTDANGVARTMLSAITPGNANIFAYFSRAGDNTVRTDQVVRVLFLSGSNPNSSNPNVGPGVPNSANSSFTAPPGSVPADGTSFTTVTITVRDSNGNPVPTSSVTLHAGSGVTINSNTLVTDASGVATTTITSTIAANEQIIATLANGETLSTTITFVAGPVSSFTSTLAANPNVVLADANATTSLTFMAADAFNNPVPNTSVFLSSSGSFNILSPSTGTTDAAGAFTATLASGKAETKTVTATAGGVSVNQNVLFIAGQPSDATSEFTASPNVIAADGSSSSLLTVVITDAMGNPVANEAVAVSATGSNNTFTQSMGTTDGNGMFSTLFASTTAEIKTVSATFSGGTLTTEVMFLSGPASSTTTTLSASPSSVTADGTSLTTLTATVKDAFGNPVSDQGVVLSASGANNALSPASGVTNAYGVFSATMASTTAEVKTVTATAGAAVATTSVTFVAGAPSSITSIFITSPTSVTADGNSTATLSLTLTDAHGNPVPSQSVTLSASGSNNTITPPSGSTDASGDFSATISSTTVQSENITVTAGGVTLQVVVTFQAGPAADGNTTFVVSPNNVVADGTSSATLTLTAEDAQGNPAVGQAVTFSASDANNTFSATTGITNGTGTVSVTVSSTTAQTETITAKTGVVTKTAALVFIAGQPATNRTTISANPSPVRADGVTTTLITVTVEDAYGNPVANTAVTLAVTGSNNTVVPTRATTNSSGVFTASLASTRAETKTITASAGLAQPSTTVVFTAGPASAGNITIVASPNTVAADGSSASTLTTTVLDAYGNPVAGQSVVLTVTGSNDSLNPNSGTTDPNGMVVATLTSTTPETKTVTATVGSFVANTNVLFTTPVISTTNSNITITPLTVAANGNATATITVTVRNGSNTPVIGQAVTFSSTGSSNVFSSSTATTDGSGNASVTLASTKAEVKTVSAICDGTVLNANVTYVAGSPNGMTSSVSASPNTVTADGVTTTTLTVLALDSFGNPVANQPVSVSSTGGNNTLNPNAGSTNAAGIFTATLASTKAESKTVTALVAGMPEQTTVTFVAGGASSITSSLTVNPTTVTADGNSTSLITFTVQDSDGNPVMGQAVSVSATGTNNVFTPASGSTNASGVFTATLASSTAQAKTVTATAGAATKTAAVTFVAGQPSSTTSTLVASPNNLLANGSAATTITFTVKDLQGNPVTNRAVSITSTGTANTWGSNGGSGTSDGNGVFTTTLSSTMAQLKTLTGTAGSASVTVNANFLAGPPASTTTTLSASPTSVTANGVSTTTLKVVVEDAYGNPVVGQAVTFAASGASFTLNPNIGTTSSAGIVTATLAATVAEVKTVTASFAGLQETAMVTFVAGPPSSATFTASPNSLTADGTSTTTLTLVVQDAQGNPVPNTAVTLGASGSNNSFSASSGNTNSAGVFTATLSSTKAQTETLTATVGSLQPTQTITFVAGSPSSTTSTVNASPTTLIADGTSMSTIIVAVLDAQGNPVAGQAVSLALSGTGNSSGALSGTSNTSGQWSTTLASTVAQSETVTATINSSFSTTATVTFVAGPAASSTLTASPTSSPVGSNTQLTVTVKDAHGNLVSGQQVTFSGAGTNNTFSPVSGTTNTSGVLTATLTSTKPQTETVTAKSGSATATTNVTFTTGSASSTTSSIVANPSSAPANDTPIVLTITLEDAYGNPISGQIVMPSITGSGINYQSGNGATDSHGVCVYTATSTTPQTANVKVTVGSMTIQTSITFTAVTAPSQPNSSFTASPNTNVPANGSNGSTLTVTVRDASNNAISGQPVTFSSSGSNNVFSSNPVLTNASGVATATFTSSTAETKAVTAAFGGVTKNANVTFVQVPYKLVFTTSPGNTSSYAPCVLGPSAVVAIEDSSGNLVSSANNAITLSIATNANNGTIGGTTSLMASSGTATFTDVTISKGGSGYTLQASASGLVSATSAAFNNTTACADQTFNSASGLTSVTSIAAGDFDDDGYDDVVVAAASSKSIKILYGDGTGSFGARKYSMTATATFYNVVSADLNGDNYADLAMANATASSNAGVVYLNNRSGGFGTATAVGLAANANNIAVLDINNDGHMDLVASGPNSISWVLNNGTGSMGTPGSQALSGPVWSPWVSLTQGYTSYAAIATSSLAVDTKFYGSPSSSTSVSLSMATAMTGTTMMSVWSQGGGILDYRYRTASTNGQGLLPTTATPNEKYYDGTVMSGTAVSILIATDTGVEVMDLDSVCTVSKDSVFNTGHKTLWITTGDFNNDGVVDLATLNYDDNSVSAILLP